MTSATDSIQLLAFRGVSAQISASHKMERAGSKGSAGEDVELEERVWPPFPNEGIFEPGERDGQANLLWI